MPNIEAVALTDFQHDDIRAREGHPVANLDEHLARELETRGLIRIRVAPLRGRRILGVNVGKVQAAGAGSPSSSSQAALHSPSTTAPLSALGAKPNRNRGG